MYCSVSLTDGKPLPRCSNSNREDSGCPAPPQLAVEDGYPQPREPLNSRNHFVAEHFLRTARGDRRSTFFRNVQAAFVLTSNEPNDGDCPCDNENQCTMNDYSNTPSKLYNVSASSDIPTVTVWYNNQVIFAMFLILNSNNFSVAVGLPYGCRRSQCLPQCAAQEHHGRG